jgi:hypothetical protein
MCIVDRLGLGRMTERRDLLLAEGGTDFDGEVAGRIQHGAAALGLGYRPPAPQAILPKPGHGDVGNKTRFPHLHIPGDDYGQRSEEAFH